MFKKIFLSCVLVGLSHVASASDDSNTAKQERQLRQQKEEIEQLKTQRQIDKANQESRDIERDTKRKSEELKKWQPGQTGLR